MSRGEGGGGESHNVVIYCRARHCGRPRRGRCDGSRSLAVEEEKNSFPSAFLSPFTFTSEVIGQVSTTRRFTRPWWDGKPTENYSKGRRLFEIILARYFDGAGAKLVAALLTTLRYNRARGGGREGGRLCPSPPPARHSCGRMGHALLESGRTVTAVTAETASTIMGERTRRTSREGT